MMMKMLQAGGMELVTDAARKSDENNPKGYYEFKPVKEIAKDPSFLEFCDGKAVKIISWLIKFLPDTYQYQTIFMARNISEIITSQNRMLEREGKKSDTNNPETLATIYVKHLNDIDAWMSLQENITCLRMNYNNIIEDPVGNSNHIADFINYDLDAGKMAREIDPSLYRQRMKPFYNQG